MEFNPAQTAASIRYTKVNNHSSEDRFSSAPWPHDNVFLTKSSYKGFDSQKTTLTYILDHASVH